MFRGADCQRNAEIVGNLPNVPIYGKIVSN